MGDSKTTREDRQQALNAQREGYPIGITSHEWLKKGGFSGVRFDGLLSDVADAIATAREQGRQEALKALTGKLGKKRCVEELLMAMQLQVPD